MLADTEGPFLEPTSHTYWYKNKLVDYSGEQFADAETASKGRAEQIGIANPVIEGTEASKLYIPEAAAKKLESVTTAGGRTRFAIDNDIEVESTPSARFCSV